MFKQAGQSGHLSLVSSLALSASLHSLKNMLLIGSSARLIHKVTAGTSSSLLWCVGLPSALSSADGEMATLLGRTMVLLHCAPPALMPVSQLHFPSTSCLLKGRAHCLSSPPPPCLGGWCCLPSSLSLSFKHTNTVESCCCCLCSTSSYHHSSFLFPFPLLSSSRHTHLALCTVYVHARC